MWVDRTKAITIIKELPTEGHSPLLVIGSDFKTYVAKNDKGKKPPFSLINEILSASFLKAWKIEVPDFKLLELNKELVKSKNGLSVNHQSYFYEDISFGSAFIKNAIDVNDLIITNRRKQFNRLINPLDVLRITLFDTWVENDDRKPTNYNLLFQPEGKKLRVVPIDHAFIFGTISYKDLNPDFVAVSANDHLLVSELGILIKEILPIDDDFIKREREYFYLRTNQCEQIFDSLFKEISMFYTIDQESIIKLKEFLFNSSRNNKVFEEYVYRLRQ